MYLNVQKRNIAVFPGTFDPITFGHLDVISRSVKIFDKLIIGIAENSKKKPLFSLEERLSMIEEQIQIMFDRYLCKIEVRIINGLLVDFMQREKVFINVRGLRMSSDFLYEFQMSCINKKLNPQIETIFLPSLEEKQFISSSLVKEVALLGGDVSKFIPKEIVNYLIKKIK